MTRLLLPASLLVLSACQPAVTFVDAGTETPPDSGTPVDAGVALPCDGGSHEVDGGCVTEVAWVGLGITGPQARDHHGTFIVPTADGGAVLYVTGGVDMVVPRAFVDLWHTRLGADGIPTGWTEATGASKPSVWHTGQGVAQTEGRVYVVSGQSMDNTGRAVLTPRVTSLAVDADGLPQGWREEKPIPGAGRFHVTTTRVGRFLFTVGGRELAPSRDNVYRAEILADGVLSDWTELAPLPETRTHHSAFAVGDRLYVLGGFSADSFTAPATADHADYLVATVGADGALSAWQRHPLPFNISTHASVVLGGFVWLTGGFDAQLNMLDTVRRAPLLPDGTLGAWESMAPLPFPRAHVHHTPAWNGNVYAMCGNQGNHVTTDAVVVGFVY